MIYTKEALENALDFLLPAIKEAKGCGIYFNTPQLITMVAEDYFVKTLDSEWSPSFDSLVAYRIVGSAMKDLKEDGWMTFGTLDYQFEDEEDN